MPVDRGKSNSEWDSQDLAKWITALYERKDPPSLSKNYAENVIQHNIDGKALKAMTAKEWKQIGITAVGDIKLIEQEAMKFAN
jgi:hypothetical protein